MEKHHLLLQLLQQFQIEHRVAEFNGYYIAYNDIDADVGFVAVIEQLNCK